MPPRSRRATERGPCDRLGPRDRGLDAGSTLTGSAPAPEVLAIALTPRLSVKGSTGIYYQQPAFQFLAIFPQNRALRPFRADHYVGGVAYAVADRVYDSQQPPGI